MFMKPNTDRSWIVRKIFDSIIYTILIWVVLFVLLYDSAVVYDVSMQPTLNSLSGLDNDMVYYNVVSNYLYGDIVIIDNGNGELIIKRVIAKDGDKVRYQYNADTNIYDLYLNDQVLVEDYVKEDITPNKLMTSNNVNKYKDSTDPTGYNPFGLLKSIQEDRFDDQGNYLVRDGEVFVMGDNRIKSTDSKTHGAYLDSSIVGVVDLIIHKGESTIIKLLQFLF